jgi:hypothetical protein
MAALPTPRRSTEVAEFIVRLKLAARAGTGHGRLIFALDATASRERAVWVLVRHLLPGFGFIEPCAASIQGFRDDSLRRA